MAQGSLRVSVARSARNCAAASSSRNAAFLARAPDAALVGAARRPVGSLADAGPVRAPRVLEAAALRTWPLALAIDPLRSLAAEPLEASGSDRRLEDPGTLGPISLTTLAVTRMLALPIPGSR
jgi:hypothetical protein